MSNKEKVRKVSIQTHLKRLSNMPGHKQRLGVLTPLAGYPLIILFAVFLLPLYLYMLFFNRAYFWVRNQDPIPSAPYYNYDRHKIAHLGLVDKIWCEYCEWANGTLQWTLAVTNEIERRYCPIKNKPCPHCEKAKAWREHFLAYDHTAEDLGKYYEEQYIRETPRQ
jgi:hypothetical protein